MKRLNEKQWRDEKQTRDAVLLKAVDTEVTESEEERVLNFRISTETPDSYDDVIKADGWDLERFKKNPVVLWAHDHRQPPVGQALDIGVEGADLVASAKFADAETYAFADTVYRLLKGKFLRATSVGFFPQEWTYDEDRGGFNFIKQELFEFSVVPVPANPDALSMALKAGEIDIAPLKEWAEKTLDMWKPDESVALWIPRSQIEDIHKSLNPPVETVTVSNQFDGTDAVVIEEAMEDITAAVVDADNFGTIDQLALDYKEKVVKPFIEKLEARIDHKMALAEVIGEVKLPDPDVLEGESPIKTAMKEFKDGAVEPHLDKLAAKVEIEVVEKGAVDKLNERIDILADDNENLRAQLDQLVAKSASEKEEAEDASDLSEIIDFSIDSHEVESEIDLSLLDLDVDPESLQGLIVSAIEREIMNRTGKLPKEV